MKSNPNITIDNVKIRRKMNEKIIKQNQIEWKNVCMCIFMNLCICVNYIRIVNVFKNFNAEYSLYKFYVWKKK